MPVEHLLCEKGHSERIWSVAWSPVDNIFATSSADLSVKLWRLIDRRAKGITEGDEGSDDGGHRSLLCSNNSQDCGSRYNFELEFAIEDHFKKSVRSVRFSPNGEYLICACFDSKVTLWKQEGKKDWQCVSVLEGHENEVKCAAMDYSNTFVASCGRDKTIWIYEKSHYNPDTTLTDPSVCDDTNCNFFCAAILSGHSQDVKCVCWNPMATLLASASYDNSIRLWTLSDGDWRCTQTITLHTSTVWSLAFNQNGTKLVSASADKSVMVHQSPKMVEKCNLSAVGVLGESVILSSNSYLSADVRDVLRSRVCEKGTSAVVDDWILLSVIENLHERDIYSVEWANYILTGSGDNCITVLQEESDNSLCIKERVEAHSSDVNCVSWKKTGRQGEDDHILATVGDDEYVKIWRLTY